MRKWISKVFGIAGLAVVLSGFMMTASAQSVTRSLSISRQATLAGQALQPVRDLFQERVERQPWHRAALVKVRSLPAVRKATRSFGFSRSIYGLW